MKGGASFALFVCASLARRAEDVGGTRARAWPGSEMSSTKRNAWLLNGLFRWPRNLRMKHARSRNFLSAPDVQVVFTLSPNEASIVGTALTQPSTPAKPSSPRFPPAGEMALAWAAMLIASDLDSIVAHIFPISPPTWYFAIAKAVILCLVALSVRLLATTSYLQRFIWLLAALVAGDCVITSIQAHVGWFQTAPRAQRMFAGVFLSFIPSALGALTLVRSGLTRHDLFLAVGDLRARTRLPFLSRKRWSVVAPLLLALISSTLLVQLWIVSNASHYFRPGLLLTGLLPASVFAALNAFSEEFRFRCLPLAYGSRFMGVGQAIAATSILFGLAHFGGHPSGFSGVAMAAFFAWIVARSVVDTRGLGWAWSLHFIQDVIIFLMVVMTGV